MDRDVRKALVVVALIIVVFAPLAGWMQNGWDLPNVVVCLNEGGPNVPGGPGTPTLNVDITRTRGGQITERHAFGCTFYWFYRPFY
jgi:hypothetical protein